MHLHTACFALFVLLMPPSHIPAVTMLLVQMAAFTNEALQILIQALAENVITSPPLLACLCNCAQHLHSSVRLRASWTTRYWLSVILHLEVRLIRAALVLSHTGAEQQVSLVKYELHNTDNCVSANVVVSRRTE